MYKVLCEHCRVLSDVQPVECYGRVWKTNVNIAARGLLFHCPVCNNEWFAGVEDVQLPCDGRSKSLQNSCGESLFTIEERSPFEVT